MPDTIHTLPFNVIARGAGNPRTTFEPGALAELAASIKAKGVLHNLLVRPVAKTGARRKKGNGQETHEVVVGERRLRAVGQLVNDGALPPDTPLPVRVVAIDDVEALRLATAENVQREDLHPLDEGAAYVRLAKAGDGTKTIAAVVGKTQRHVQLRIALAEKLSKKTTAAFRTGDVTLAQARVLTIASAERQDDVLEGVKAGHYHTADYLKNAVTDNLPPLGWAIFDRALYTGEVLEDPDDPAAGWFADEAQALRLQENAIKALEATLGKKYAWVKVTRGDKGRYFQSWEYDPCKDKKKAGAVIEVGRGLRVKTHTDLVKRVERKSAAGATAQDGAPAKPKDPAAAFTKGHLTLCHAAKTQALQDAIAGSPATALRLVCMGLLGATNNVRISAERHGYGACALGAVPTTVLGDFRKDFAKVVLGEKETDSQLGLLRVHSLGAYGSDKAEAAAWEVLKGLSDDEVLSLLAAMVALRCGTFDAYDPTLGDRPVAVTLGAELGVDMGKAWTIDGDFLEGCRKPALVQIAAGLGITAALEKDKATKTAKAMRAGILAHLPKKTKYVPPTMRLAERGVIVKALTAKPKKG